MNTPSNVLGALLALAVSSGAVLAQEQGGQTLNANNPPANVPANDLTALAAAVQRLEAQVNGLPDKYVTRDEFEKLQEIVAKQTQLIGTLQEGLAEQGQQISSIDSKYQTSIAALNEQAAQINSILNAISRTDSQNRPILNIASAMQSQEFQQDLADAVDNTLRQQRPMGRLTITNNMGYTQALRVNGVYHYISPGTTREIQVPLGTVTTELDGESPKNWVIAPPNYRQGIIIAPRQSPIVLTSIWP